MNYIEYDVKNQKLALCCAERGIPLLLAWRETSSADTWVRKLFHTVEKKMRIPMRLKGPKPRK